MHLLVFFDITGRLHPVLVHLPIGILLLACFFELVSSEKRLPSLRPAIPAMIFWGMMAAIASVLTGLALSGNGEYDEDLIQTHEWSGISLAAISVVLYVLYKKRVHKKLIKTVSILVICLIFITGHLGGSITHGSDFITAPLTGGEEAIAIKPIPDIQQAVLYTDVVQPLFQARCYNCHSSRKQKGKLRLDEQDLILKGGESGKSIVIGKPEESELIERLLLPLDHDDHMPPKGKPQLTKEQIDVLHWWVNTGADFNKKVSELKQTESIKPSLLALQSGSSSVEKEIPDIPVAAVPHGDTAVIRKMTAAGVMIIPVARESNYLSANFVTATGNIDSLISALQSLNKQLISLKLDEVQLHDSTAIKIAGLASLRKLRLSNTALTDKSLSHFAKLKELRSVNLVGTKVTAAGLMQLKDLKELKYIYLYGTPINEGEIQELKKQFPEAKIELGNYSLPMLAGDTTEIKY